jgi:hypothetical protein
LNGVSHPEAGRHAQETYWNQLVLLNVVAFYVRAYRDRQARWIDGTGLLRALVTSGTIGAWIIWKDHAMIWGALVGITQMLDAAKDYLPQAKNRRSASEFLATMDNIIIDARFEWFAVFNGEYEAGEIMTRWRKLAKLLAETEARHFPDGLPANLARKNVAKAEASAYLMGLYGVGASDHG